MHAHTHTHTCATWASLLAERIPVRTRDKGRSLRESSHFGTWAYLAVLPNKPHSQKWGKRRFKNCKTQSSVQLLVLLMTHGLEFCRCSLSFCICEYICICLCTHMSIHICMLPLCVCIYIHIYTCLYIPIYTYTYTYIFHIHVKFLDGNWEFKT